MRRWQGALAAAAAALLVFLLCSPCVCWAHHHVSLHWSCVALGAVVRCQQQCVACSSKQGVLAAMSTSRVRQSLFLERHACVAVQVSLPALLLADTWASRRHWLPLHAYAGSICLCTLARGVGQVSNTWSSTCDSVLVRLEHPLAPCALRTVVLPTHAVRGVHAIGCL